MRVLAIESTCDETGACIAESFEGGVKIIAETKATSAEITSKYGGIVPEVVAREQVAAIIPVIQETLVKFSGTNNDIEAIAVAYGPGLIGSLLIGVETAKTLALVWKKPLLGVNHMAAHVLANWIQDKSKGERIKDKVEIPEMPAVGLVVSGGHTDLILMKSLTDWQWIGGTRDDAVGEVFDKVARAMGLPYPGGPAVAKLAAEFSILNSPARDAFSIADAGGKFSSKEKLPRPMIHEDSLSMSFSGLKTAVMQRVAEKEDLNWLAWDFNNAVVDVLVNKTMKAVEAYQPKSVILAGGVAANQLLRQQLKFSILNSQFSSKVFIPDLRYCTDNAAMIGAGALLRPKYFDPLRLRPDSRLELR